MVGTKRPKLLGICAMCGQTVPLNETIMVVDHTHKKNLRACKDCLQFSAAIGDGKHYEPLNKKT